MTATKNTTGNQKLPYPKSVFFIIVNEFCERFTFYGLRTILSLYLTFELAYDADSSTVIYHVFIMFCYFFPLIGAMVADSWLGKFRTIFYLSTIYAIGSVVMSVFAIPDLPLRRELTVIGLVLIAFGTGGIKPCVSAFGGDQFIVPQQEQQLQKFFSLFYFAINSGSLISTFVTPILRDDVGCFGKDSCFSLAFAVPAILMLVALGIFLGGKKYYKMKEPEGNIILKVSKCIWHAARKKDAEKRDHWLYKAEDKYDRQFIEEIIATLRVLFLYLPLPIFWALFDQQGSRWTFQAGRMKFDVGGVKIKPDQMQVVNPVLILAFIPLFDKVLYPLLAKFRLLTKPLQRITVGGLLAALSFAVSAVVEICLEQTYPVLPGAGEAQLRIFNAAPSELTAHWMRDDVAHTHVLKDMESFADLHVNVRGTESFAAKWKIPSGEFVEKEIVLEEGKASSYAFLANGNVESVIHESVDKDSKGKPKIMLVYSPSSEGSSERTVKFVPKRGGDVIEFEASVGKCVHDFRASQADTYAVYDNDIKVADVKLEDGGIYSFILREGGVWKLETIAEPNSISILWLIPQYVIMTAGEVMFSITGLEFSFMQAPVSMKSLMQAAWLLTVSVGNLIVVIIAQSRLLSSQTYEFVLFAALMLLDMFVFALIAMRYKYVEIPSDDVGELEMNPPKTAGEKEQ